VTRLPDPIKNVLRDGADEVALQRIWRKIDASLPRSRRRSSALLLLPLAAVAGVAAVVFVTGGALRRDAGPLGLADGKPLSSVDAPAEGTLLSMSDGSSVRLEGGARFEPVESSGTSFVAILQRGSAAFEVRPGGPRRWQIECGLATVEVVGTKFACDRGPERLRVSVEHGAVLVRGERVPDRVRRLAAGEALELTEAVSPVPAQVDPVVAPETEAAIEPARPAASPRAAAKPSWRELALGGRHAEAFAALGSPGIRREAKRVGVSDLFALADVARLSGHPGDAVGPLTRIVTEHSEDPQAPLAAFALGRLELDDLSQPTRAVSALERALSLGAPQSLREDVRARLVEAYVRTGDHAAARTAADAYLREFPRGRHRAAIEVQLAR
jgi:transmembrane sensor